jgi:starch synthase
MIAMHYGCIPIARSTGGLSDTIHDPLEHRISTGFLFKPAKPEALADAIRRALAVFDGSPSAWQEMQVHGMQQDFSWDRSAQEYYQLYNKLLESN